jgi:hypothetical protein
MGMYGKSVKRNIITGGIVMVKLKAMADALSVNPTFFACKMKKRITSNKGIPWKPGRNTFLLFRIRKLTGGEMRSLRFMRVSRYME